MFVRVLVVITVGEYTRVAETEAECFGLDEHNGCEALRVSDMFKDMECPSVVLTYIRAELVPRYKCVFIIHLQLHTPDVHGALLV
jgi:hypothetical protein